MVLSRRMNSRLMAFARSLARRIVPFDDRTVEGCYIADLSLPGGNDDRCPAIVVMVPKKWHGSLSTFVRTLAAALVSPDGLLPDGSHIVRPVAIVIPASVQSNVRLRGWLPESFGSVIRRRGRGTTARRSAGEFRTVR